MSKQDELASLRTACIAIAGMDDRDLRAKRGRWLEHQCRNFDEEYRVLGGLDDEAEVELRAIIQVIFDYILFDDIEDKDWQGAFPTHFEGDMRSVLTDLQRNQKADRG